MSRNTIQQDIIWNTVKGMCTHPSPDEVYEKVRADYPGIGRATVYRTLNKLAQKGEIKKISLPNTADRFDFRTDKHIHMRCKYCNRVFDAELGNREEVLDWLDRLTACDTDQSDGFEITEFHLSFEGICRDCLADLKNKE